MAEGRGNGVCGAARARGVGGEREAGRARERHTGERGAQRSGARAPVRVRKRVRSRQRQTETRSWRWGRRRARGRTGREDRRRALCPHEVWRSRSRLTRTPEQPLRRRRCRGWRLHHGLLCPQWRRGRTTASWSIPPTRPVRSGARSCRNSRISALSRMRLPPRRSRRCTQLRLCPVGTLPSIRRS